MTDDQPSSEIGGQPEKEAPPPAPPPQELLARLDLPARTTPETLADFFRDRMEAIELELAKERERAREAEMLLRQQESIRAQADQELKGILLQLKAEKKERERDEERSHAQGRIDSLEKRLDEMHSAWMNILKEAISKREEGTAGTAVQAAASAAGLRAISENVAAARDELSRMPETVSQIGATLTDRLQEMERKLAQELQHHEESARALARERGSLSEALEEQRHQIRQEYNKERMALQARFQEQLDEFKRELKNASVPREADSRTLQELRAATARIAETLGRPSGAKDEAIAALEREKQDLLQALQDRTAALRAYTLERRDVERSLGESLMDLHRQFQAERSKQQGLEARIAELGLGIEAGKRREKLHETVVAERDHLLKAILEAAQKLRQAEAAHAEERRAWEKRVSEVVQSAEQDRQSRAAAQRESAELQSKIQTLSDHIAQILREKERAEAQFSQWRDEREKLFAELQKKEQLLSLLSSTFQGLIPK